VEGNAAGAARAQALKRAESLSVVGGPLVNAQESEFLLHNLKAELDAIRFYADNLQRLNYAKNRKAIDALALDSVTHAQMLLRAYLEANAKVGGRLTPLALEKAMQEETGLKEIYRFEEGKVKSPKLRKLFAKLVKWEEAHEALVKTLK
jgi:rubrerythrin